MATTYEEIIGFLNEDGFGFQDLRTEGKEGLALRFIDSKHDESPEFIIIKLDEGGEFVHFFEPQRYKLADCEHKAEVFETLLVIQNETKMLQWEYEPSNGHIRGCVELPLEDAKLTKRLFIRVLLDLAKMMDRYHERIKQVMKTGEDSVVNDQHQEAVAMLESLLRKLQGKDDVPDAI